MKLFSKKTEIHPIRRDLGIIAWELRSATPGYLLILLGKAIVVLTIMAFVAMCFLVLGN